MIQNTFGRAGRIIDVLSAGAEDSNDVSEAIAQHRVGKRRLRWRTRGILFAGRQGARRAVQSTRRRDRRANRRLDLR